MGYEWVLLILATKDKTIEIKEIPMETYRLCVQAEKKFNDATSSYWGTYKGICMQVKEIKGLERK